MGKGYDVMGYWDCPMCQTKKILGTERNCPNCGMPRGEDVKFYMDGPEVKLTEEQQQKKGKGADWMCEYCGGYNSALDTVCVSCGAERSGKDYFEIRKAKEKKQAEKQAEKDQEKKELDDAIRNKKKEEVKKKCKKKLLIGLFIFLLITAGLMFLGRSKEYQVTLADKYWQSSVDVEKYAEVYESDWTLPDGAELDHKEKEIRTYEQVQHGTTTETYESYEQVGSHEETTYTDNGDGTFHSSTTTVPDYDYVTRTREVPNYVSEPVYDTKYYYYIWRWQYDRTLTAEEHGDKKVYYAKEDLSDDERYKNKQCSYYLTFHDNEKDEDETYEVTKEQYKQVETGAGYTIVVSVDEITEITPAE